MVDGHEAQRYTPNSATLAPPQICWWRFGITGTGTHHVRAADVGTPQQQIWIDGVPLDAPPGTMSFTGPGACLLELIQREDGQWMLVCDGYPLEQHNPANDSGEPSLVWQFALAEGHHLLAVTELRQVSSSSWMGLTCRCRRAPLNSRVQAAVGRSSPGRSVRSPAEVERRRVDPFRKWASTNGTCF
ncbi:unnamed protein product [Durusdinium trenchii]|uniref:Uncharacterized protein n=1 Tax=Durusdinium trenchii TaxID=1381693 RepID=A0ABP0L3X2_9DINO